MKTNVAKQTFGVALFAGITSSRWIQTIDDVADGTSGLSTGSGGPEEDKPRAARK